MYYCCSCSSSSSSSSSCEKVDQVADVVNHIGGIPCCYSKTQLAVNGNFIGERAVAAATDLILGMEL